MGVARCRTPSRLLAVHQLAHALLPGDVLRRPLPALVGGAGTDEVHVCPEIAALGPDSLTRAARLQPERAGRLIIEGVAREPRCLAVCAHLAAHAAGRFPTPELLPVPKRALLLGAQQGGFAAEHHRVALGGVDVPALGPVDQLAQHSLPLIILGGALPT